MNKNRSDQIDKWANYVINNPDWKGIHTKFINAQFEKSEEFYKRLSKQKGGKKKIMKIFNIHNKKGYPDWVE